MTKYYYAKRKSNLYQPGQSKAFRLSRSKIDLFMNCPRCFYLDRRLGVAQPASFPFNLNSAVDTLLKKEFDIHRAKGTTHPMMKAYGVDAVPYQSEQMGEWRDALRGGITYLHKPTNLLITGGIDDVWVDPQGKLIIVDYKATSKDGQVNIDADWQIAYKRQMEIYQWLFKQNKFKVSKTGYFVYCNGDTDKKAFDSKLEFDVTVIPYEGDDVWVEQAITDVHTCLNQKAIPKASSTCDYCAYREEARKVEYKTGQSTLL